MGQELGCLTGLIALTLILGTMVLFAFAVGGGLAEIILRFEKWLDKAEEEDWRWK